MLGFDKQLDEMEMKIKGTVSKKLQSKDEPEEIQIGDIAAVVSEFFVFLHSLF